MKLVQLFSFLFISSSMFSQYYDAGELNFIRKEIKNSLKENTLDWYNTESIDVDRKSQFADLEGSVYNYKFYRNQNQDSSFSYQPYLIVQDKKTDSLFLFVFNLRERIFNDVAREFSQLINIFSFQYILSVSSLDKNYSVDKSIVFHKYKYTSFRSATQEEDSTRIDQLVDYEFLRENLTISLNNIHDIFRKYCQLKNKNSQVYFYTKFRKLSTSDVWVFVTWKSVKPSVFTYIKQ